MAKNTGRSRFKRQRIAGSFTTRSFPGSDVYTVDDLPEIDYLFISHDHWDHLDYKNHSQTHPQGKKGYYGLGTGEHLEYWGFAPDQLIEKDWHESAVLDSGFTVTVTPGRHFSGRGLTRNKALWVSFCAENTHYEPISGWRFRLRHAFCHHRKITGPF